MFSRNEYEIPLKKCGKEAANENDETGHRNKKKKMDTKSHKEEDDDNEEADEDDDDEDDATSDDEDEDFENMGPYSTAINEINCDNPQDYHQIFHKKLNTNHHHHQNNSSSNNNNSNEMEASPVTSNTKSKQISSRVSSSSNEKNSRTDDLIKYWKRFSKYESIIAKRLKESEKLLKTIFVYLCEIKNIEDDLKEETSSTGAKKDNTDKKDVETSQQAPKSDHELASEAKTSEKSFNLSKYSNQIKKSLYSVALLLGVNIDLISDNNSSNSSNKTEILDSHIKKIHHELVGMKLSQNSSLLPFYISKQIDPNSITLLNFMYENLKKKFLNQFHHFKSQKKRLLNSSPMNLPTSTNSAFNIQEYLSKPFSDSDFPSSNNTTSLNDYDDSSTYLFDSPTISFESNEKPEKNNPNAKKSGGKAQVGHVKSNSKSQTISSSSDNSNIINMKGMDNVKPTTSSRAHGNSSSSSSKKENSYDDSLCVKLMQNYIDLFKKKDATAEENVAEDDGNNTK